MGDGLGEHLGGVSLVRQRRMRRNG
jgi:hypothetical protein